MGATSIGLTQQEDRERGVDQQHVFHGVTFFLAAITARLLSRILGALDAPFGAIVAKGGRRALAARRRGQIDGGGDPSVGTTMAAASASATPRRLANSATDRVGASPSVRSVACSTAKRT